MEWFWQFLATVEKSVAFTALKNAQPLDWIFLFIILWGLAQGSRKGFSDMFGKLLGIFLTSMLVMSFWKSLAVFFEAKMPVLSMQAALPFAFFLLSIICWLSVTWCINVSGIFFRVEALGVLKSLGGMVLGGLRMMLLLSFIVQFLLSLPFEELKKNFKPGRTYTGYTIARLVPDLHKLVLSPFLKQGRKNSAVPSKTSG